MCDIKKCEMMCSDEVTELAKAMLEVQRAVRPACKDSFNEFTRSKYATLGSVMEACRDTLIDNGIWVTQFPVDVGVSHTLGLVTKMVHVDSGQWQSSLLVMPLPKNDPQGYGSALTYARRYGLSALVGIVTEDDDGNLASTTSSNQASSTTVLNGQNQPRFQPQKAVKPAFNGQQSSKPQQNQINNKVGNNQQNGKNATNKNVVNQNATSGLPKVDGVVFKTMKSDDGNEFITATGNTHAKKAILKQAGFRWEPEQKLWWRNVAS